MSGNFPDGQENIDDLPDEDWEEPDYDDLYDDLDD